MSTNIRSTAFASLFKEFNLDNETAINIFVKYKLIELYKTDIQYYEEYTITSYDRWDSLAYKFYIDVNLWWVIALFNSVIDPFNTLVVGTKINVIKSKYLPEIFRAINKLKNG